MIKLIFAFCFFLVTIDGRLYLDRYTAEGNPLVTNLSVNCITDANQNVVTNVTFGNLVTFTRLMAYFSLKIAEDQNDREYKREYIKTLIDVGKMFKDSHANLFVKNYANSLRKFMDFEMNFPLKPVSSVRGWMCL